MYYLLTLIFPMTIVWSVWYFYSHYQFSFGYHDPGEIYLLWRRYEQNKVLYFTTRFPWIVALNIIAIILTIIVEKLFKKSLIKRILETTEFYKNQDIVEMIRKIKYFENIKKEQRIRACILKLERF